jgi:HD domain.
MENIVNMEKIMDNQYKKEFCEIFETHVNRDGADKFLDWLQTTDFFSAPASTKYHCACESGLVMHSLNVYKVMREKYFSETDSEETFALCALLHDVCKAQFYKISTRNVKNDETGQWEKKPFYSIEDMFPYGHGEKSVYLIERFIRLKPTEAMAIRWHMGGFDESVKGGSFAMSSAFDKYPLAVKLHLSDLEATYLLEHGTSEVR